MLRRTMETHNSSDFSCNRAAAAVNTYCTIVNSTTSAVQQQPRFKLLHCDRHDAFVCAVCSVQFSAGDPNHDRVCACNARIKHASSHLVMSSCYDVLYRNAFLCNQTPFELATPPGISSPHVPKGALHTWGRSDRSDRSSRFPAVMMCCRGSVQYRSKPGNMS